MYEQSTIQPQRPRNVSSLESTKRLAQLVTVMSWLKVRKHVSVLFIFLEFVRICCIFLTSCLYNFLIVVFFWSRSLKLYCVIFCVMLSCDFIKEIFIDNFLYKCVTSSLKRCF